MREGTHHPSPWGFPKWIVIAAYGLSIPVEAYRLASYLVKKFCSGRYGK